MKTAKSQTPNPKSQTEQLRETARTLLEEKRADLVIGYERGSSKRRVRPVAIRNERDADRLIFDNTCGPSLVPFVRKALRAAAPSNKVAVVAKGCDGRALVQQVAEGQLKRDQVVIIGVGCSGIVDWKREANGEKRDVSCERCHYPNPPVFDVFVGEPVKAESDERGTLNDEFAGVAEFEKLSSADRWAWFERELAKCIRCYACRNACPMCYCEECFVDQSHPQWLGKSAERPDTTLFHLVRALHTAGRCVDCGACERACPFGVRLGLLNKRLEQEVRERFGYTAGLSMEATPAMAAYSEDDRQEFIQ